MTMNYMNLGTEFIDLAKEFEEDAKMLERIAEIYLTKGFRERYDILWHEAAVYRCCQDRLQQIIVASNFREGALPI